jgi:hypothetical protein
MAPDQTTHEDGVILVEMDFIVVITFSLSYTNIGSSG